MAAATTIVMAAGAAVSAGSSFIQAKKQKDKMEKAERDADKFMMEARGKLETNYMEELSLSMRPYERAREQNLVMATTAMQAGLEGDERGAAVTAGKVLQGSQKLEGEITDKQISAIQDLEKLTADEESRLRDERVNLDLAEFEGKKTEAARAEEARTKAIQQGISSTMQLGSAAVSHFAPLYQGGGQPDMSGLGFQNQYKTTATGTGIAPNQNFNLQSHKLQPPSLGMLNPNDPSIFNQMGTNPFSSSYQQNYVQPQTFSIPGMSTMNAYMSGLGGN